MRFVNFALENNKFILVIIALLTINGIVSFLTMPRMEDPQVTMPGSSVVVIYPGANPKNMEELVVDPIEKAINELEDIKELKSSIEDGLSIISVEFTPGSDPNEKYSHVVEKVNGIKSSLPEDIYYLNVDKWSVTDVNILQIALISDVVEYKELEKEAKRLEKLIAKVSGIKKSQSVAIPKREVRIELDLDRMAINGISLERIVGAIQSANANIPGGNIELGSKKYSLQTSGSYQSLQEIENTVVNAGGGKILKLKDVASVSFKYEDNNYYARVNGKKAVFIIASQKENTNIVSIMKEAKENIDKFSSELPSNIQLKYVFDQSRSVNKRINDFFINLLQGVFIVGIGVFLTVGFKASIIVMIVVPVSLLMAIGFVDLSGFGLEQMTFVGLVIALSLLVSNAIFITENVARYLRNGADSQLASYKGTSEIAYAVASSTITTVFAFIPIIMMKNTAGEFIRSMPASVSFALIASLFVSLTLTSYLSGKYLKKTDNIEKRKIDIALKRFIETKYRRVLYYALKKSKSTLIISAAVFVASLGLFPVVGVSLFPKADKPQFMIDIISPQGASLSRTDSIASFVENILSKNPIVETYAANIGKGNPWIYYNVFPKHEMSHYGNIFVQLKETSTKNVSEYIEELREKFKDYPGAKIEIKEFEQGVPMEAPIAIKIIGDDLDRLKEYSKIVENIVKETEGVINVENQLSSAKHDLYVNINKDKAGIYGVPLLAIDKTIRTCIAGSSISKFRDNEGKEYNIVLRAPLKEGKPSLRDLEKIYVVSLSGSNIPLKHLADVEFKRTLSQIQHYALERNATIKADVKAGYSVDIAAKEIIKKLNKIDWNKNFKYKTLGEIEKRAETFDGMLQAAIIAAIAIFAVLCLQFKSFTQPLVVFSTIPMAITGSLIALAVAGFTFSFTAFIGLTSLIGIVVNNAIILLDYANQLQKQGKSFDEAIIMSAEIRFTPIILSTFTTIGGLLPLTFQGGALWSPMCLTIIGGLVISTVLTLVVTPALYKTFYKVI